MRLALRELRTITERARRRQGDRQPDRQVERVRLQLARVIDQVVGKREQDQGQECGSPRQNAASQPCEQAERGDPAGQRDQPRDVPRRAQRRYQRSLRDQETDGRQLIVGQRLREIEDRLVDDIGP